MERMLITPSLLNAFSYYMGFEGETTEDEDGNAITAAQKEAKVRAEFIQTLTREKSEANENMLAGIAFEDAIVSYCKGGAAESSVVQEIGDSVKGAMFQVVMQRPLDGYLLYAKADAVKLDTIYDFKRSKSYDLGKYSDSMQHRIELFCSGMPKFSYIISDGRGWWAEDYANHPGIEAEIRHSIRNFAGYLEGDREARNLFYDLWRAKN